MPFRHGVVVCLSSALALTCGGHEQATTEYSPTPAAEVAALNWSEILPVAPRPDVDEVEGGAQPMEEQATDDAPEEELGTRAQVRALPLPRIRRGTSTAFEMPDGQQGWVAALPNRQVLLTPAYADGRVYVGGGFTSTTMYALDAQTGAIEWRVSAPDGGPTAAIVHDDKIFFNTESCTLFAVHAETGRTIWSRWLGDPLMSMPAAAGRRIFSGHLWTESTSRYGFTAMDTRSGQVIWQREMPHDVISAPTTHDDSVYFATMDGTVFRLRQSNGRQVWRRRLRATTAPWVDGDRVLLARRVRAPEGARGPHEQQVVLDASNGEVLWEGEPVAARHLYGGGRARRIISGQAGAWGGAQGSAHGHLGVRNVAEGWAYQGPRPTVVDGRAYQVVGDQIECRRLEDGELLWSRRYAQDNSALSMSPPAVVGAQMVIATVDGHVYGLDIDTGMAVWAYDVGEPIVYQPAVARGNVYVSTSRGQVVAFPVGDEETLDGWHMWGGGPDHSGPAVDPSEIDFDDPALVSARADPSEPHDSAIEDGPGEGQMRVIVPDEHRVETLPLEHTSLTANVSGFVASVTLEQVFRNDLEEPFEAAYHFPLPTGAAVDSMLIRSGERVILGRIERKELARVIYRQARDAGLLAALLEQQRPNLFTQRVANIPPGEAVTVEIHYVQLLPYEEGEYEFLFPMVAGARAQDPTSQGDDEPVEQHTPGTRPSENIDVTLSIDSGVPIEDLFSPTHLVDVDQHADDQVSVTLSDEDSIPNRDFVIRYRVGAEMPRAAVLSHQDERGGFFTLMLQPGLDVPEELSTRRRLTFALDTSSSMLGRPMAQAQAVINEALATLGPNDELQVVTFSDLVRAYAPDGPVSGTDEQVIGAEQFVDDARALGTTSMTAGIERVLAQGVADDDVLDMIVLVTDGYVASEQELMRQVHEHLGQRRLFTIGVGPAPNRFLLERLAELGHGSTIVVSPSEHPEVVAQNFLERIERPQLTDLQVEWGDLTVHDVYPRRLPDLFGGQPLLIRGRYDVPGEAAVTVRGRIAGRVWEERVPVVLHSPDRMGHEALAPIWARAAVHDHMNGLYLRDDPDREDAITDLGLRFGLVTRFTSFVAVEDRFFTGLGGADGGFGYDGLGLHGTGRGGGGSGEGTIGLGNLNTIGHGGGGGSGSGYGYGPGLMRGRSASIPMIRTGTAQIRGSLARDVIRRTIRLHINAVRGVYERQLLRNPDLTGRVEVQLVIDSTGNVVSATVRSSTMGSTEVEQGVLTVLRGIQFPAVEGGGMNIVTYPFMFVPAPD